MFVCISSFEYKRPMLWYLLRFLPHEQRVVCLWVWSWSSPWHLPYRRSALYHLSQRLTTLMNVHLYFSYWVQKTNAQISITRTAAMPVLELTKIISRKFLLSPSAPWSPLPQLLFYWEISESCVLRVNFLCSCFCFQIQVFIQDLTQITNEIKRAETAATNAPSAMSSKWVSKHWVAKHWPAN